MPECQEIGPRRQRAGAWPSVLLAVRLVIRRQGVTNRAQGRSVVMVRLPRSSAPARARARRTGLIGLTLVAVALLVGTLAAVTGAAAAVTGAAAAVTGAAAGQLRASGVPEATNNSGSCPSNDAKPVISSRQGADAQLVPPAP